MGVYENARRETRERIVREFWKMYQETPISRITVRELADACGIHRSTVYFHFQDVYQILESIEETLLEKLTSINADRGETKEGLQAVGRQLFEEYRENRGYLRTLVLKQRDYAFSARYRSEMIRLMVDLARESSGEEDPFHGKLVSLTASVIIETFLQCADDDIFSFEDTMRIMQGFMEDGYYTTLNDTFHVPGMRNPNTRRASDL